LFVDDDAIHVLAEHLVEFRNELTVIGIGKEFAEVNDGILAGLATMAN
jgi:hypothetical protein